MEDTPLLVTVEAASTANALEDPRFGATTVLAVMKFGAAIFAAELELVGLDARTVVARTTASESNANVRRTVFMNSS
jgi:hypothetical protein